MLNGRPPFYTEDVVELYRRIENSVLEFPQDFDENAKNLIELSMNRNPDLRPTIQQLKTHEFFDNLNWHEVGIKSYPPIDVEELKKLNL